MIRVLSHGDRRQILNPVTGQWTDVVNIRFIEEGRSGGNNLMSISSAALSSAIGEDVGLALLRTHTHPVTAGTESKFPVGLELNLYINRKLYSSPQMTQQSDVAARMVDGKPTYFATYISDKPEEDVDMRLDNNVMATMAPGQFSNSIVGAAIVRTIERRQTPSGGITTTELVQPVVETSGLQQKVG